MADSGVPNDGDPDCISMLDRNDPKITGQPGRISWASAMPASASASCCASAAGIALAQLIRPGCPVIFGSFLSNIDMQSGSPRFGTPGSGIGLLCTGQLARHFGLPF